jgi:DDE superfamily endonuclease
LEFLPNGAIIYVSDFFEGVISDRQIVVQSGFLDKLQPGDVVLADRGFVIRDLLNERHVKLDIPPFLNGRTKFTPQEEIRTKQTARLRIHVERAIERVKKFCLLGKRSPLSLSPVINQIVLVACCLVNFQDPLVT